MYLHVVSRPWSEETQGRNLPKYMHIHIDTQEAIAMSIHITRRLSAALPIAAAAVFIQIGSAAAANPQVDFQQQVRDVLSGSTAAHAIQHSDGDPANAVRATPDAQQFAQQLLLGWSVSHLGRAQATKPNLQAKASGSSQKTPADEDFQSTVRQSLLGESAASRGAL